MGDKITDYNVPGWNLISYIGSGAWGNVFEAENAITSRRTILKILDPSKAAIVDMERQQKTIADILRTETVPQLFDEEDEFMRYILLPGDPIPDVVNTSTGEKTFALPSKKLPKILLNELKNGNFLKLEDSLPLLTDILRAAYLLHKKGICHNDIQPSNIGTTTKNRAVLFDFGIASSIRAGEEKPTYHVGSIKLMAPESILNRASLTPQSDLYQIGTMIYAIEMQRLTGQFTYPCKPSEEISKTDEQPRKKQEFERAQYIKDNMPGEIERLSKLGSDPKLVEIVRLLLEPDTNKRYKNAQEVLNDVSECYQKWMDGDVMKLTEWLRAKELFESQQKADDDMGYSSVWGE